MSVRLLQMRARPPSAPSSALPAAVLGRPDPSAERGRLNLTWLVHLHWWAILGQIAIFAGAELVTDIGLPVGTLLALIGLEAIGNLGLALWTRRAIVNDATIAAVMLLDAVVLTVLLDLTGGAANPFSTLYLVNVALAAVLLPPGWAWALMVVTLVSFASLFLHEEATSPHHHITVPTGLRHGELMDAHLRGMWVAFALAAVFVVFFVRRVTRELAARERDLQVARAQAERREKLASLATLAAGAAHELSTPLSTIAVVAKELQRSLQDADAAVRADLHLVREQVGRCRDILDRMAAHAGETVGERFTATTVRAWIDAAMDGLRGADRVRIEAPPESAAAALVAPPRALADALRGLLKNALQASPPHATVLLRAETRDGRVVLSVQDRGRGMPPEVLSRAGEPFFTTKSPGEGMGLGLFLTRALAEQLGGTLTISSSLGTGTEARIDLPAVETGERSNA